MEEVPSAAIPPPSSPWAIPISPTSKTDLESSSSQFGHTHVSSNNITAHPMALTQQPLTISFLQQPVICFENQILSLLSIKLSKVTLNTIPADDTVRNEEKALALKKLLLRDRSAIHSYHLQPFLKKYSHSSLTISALYNYPLLSIINIHLLPPIQGWLYRMGLRSPPMPS